jgi:uncharacterized OsmC-like protein
MKMSTVSEKTTINGVNVEELFKSIDALREMPNLASFKFRLNNRWIDGGLNRSSIKNFYGTGLEHTTRREPFILEADEPPVLLGKDQAPNPVEYLLHALAGCVTSSIVFHAAARGITIKELESRVEGEIDIRGFLGIDNSVPRGYRRIRMKFRIKADAPDDQLEEIIKLGPTYSPVYNTLTNGVPVEVQLEK